MLFFFMVSFIALEEFVAFLICHHDIILLKLANHIFNVSARHMDVALYSIARQVLIGQSSSLRVLEIACSPRLQLNHLHLEVDCFCSAFHLVPHLASTL